MRTIDCRGLVCPEPVIRTRAALAEAGAGALLVIVDNEAARGNVSRFARNNGWEVSDVTRDGSFELTLTPAAVTSAPAVATPTTAATAATTSDASTDGSVVLITADVFGRGDDALGAKLMGSFLYALAEADRVPAELLFVNGGVRLTTENITVRPHLEKLSARGSRIYSCGTCLDFYGLKDRLAIGEVTNMYAIVEACQRATRVITL